MTKFPTLAEEYKAYAEKQLSMKKSILKDLEYELSRLPKSIEERKAEVEFWTNYLKNKEYLKS